MMRYSVYKIQNRTSRIQASKNTAHGSPMNNWIAVLLLDQIAT